MQQETLEQQANKLGIPLHIEITDGIRYRECDAHMANLIAIEGKYARYKGECNVGHNYEVRRKISELQQQVQILNGGLVIGSGKGYDAGEHDLEEF